MTKPTITDAVLVLLAEKERTPGQLTDAINSEGRFSALRHKWGRLDKKQVYAAMSGLRVASRRWIEPVNGRPGISFVYRLTEAGRKAKPFAGLGDAALKLGRSMMRTIAAGERIAVPNEAVDHPAHYGGVDNPYEAIKVIEAWGLGFNLGNAVKYIARADKKGSNVEDLKKARWYLDREIANLEGVSHE